MRLTAGTMFTPLLVTLALSLLPVQAVSQEAESGQYMVNPGDTLQISVWQEEDLQGEVIVRPDGFFSFPLAGEIRASNRTISQIENALRERLKQYIPDVVATVSLLTLNGYKIYVIGQVQNPGEFTLNRDVDVMSALAMAQGLNEFADARGIRILRRVDGRQTAIDFDYRQVIRGSNLSDNVTLEAGDVVVVP